MTHGAKAFFNSLPTIADVIHTSDINQAWLDNTYWEKVSSFTSFSQEQDWNFLSVEQRGELCRPAIEEAFKLFQTYPVPKIGLRQGLLYLAIKLSVSYGFKGVTYRALEEWFALGQTIGNHNYQVRFSARENESYLVAMHI